jgi:hypothetical protein
VLREGDDITLIANGIMVSEALEAARQLEQEGVSAAVIDMFTLKPIDRMLVKKLRRETGRIVTCENHSIHNGLGSAVAEVLVETCPVPMRRVGVKERYGQVGTQDYLQKDWPDGARHCVCGPRAAVIKKAWMVAFLLSVGVKRQADNPQLLLGRLNRGQGDGVDDIVYQRATGQVVHRHASPAALARWRSGRQNAVRLCSGVTGVQIREDEHGRGRQPGSALWISPRQP